jgi:hypothetical protein
MRWLLPTMILLAGCGDALSNKLFEEDELFVAALPQEADLEHEAPEAGDPGEERAVGDEAFMPPQARAIVSSINGSVYTLLGMLDRILVLDITTREADRRIWGPYSWLEGSVRLTVERSEEARFSYRAEVADEDPSEGISAWYTLMEGTFLRGESLRDGDGSFEFDAELWGIVSGEPGDGRMVVTHSRAGEDVVLHALYEDVADGAGGLADVAYFFRRFPTGGGVFEYRTPTEIFGGEGSEVERWTARARWLPNGAGRADFLIRGGDLGDAEYAGTECWDHDLRVQYYDLDQDGLDPDGSEDDCRFLLEGPREIE